MVHGVSVCFGTNLAPSRPLVGVGPFSPDGGIFVGYEVDHSWKKAFGSVLCRRLTDFFVKIHGIKEALSGLHPMLLATFWVRAIGHIDAPLLGERKDCLPESREVNLKMSFSIN